MLAARSAPVNPRLAPISEGAPVATDTELAVTNGRMRTARGHSNAEAGRKRWSRQVTETSNALDIEKGVFSKRDPGAIARSLKRSAGQSVRRKSNPFRSAMSMLTFYINRAGKNLTKSDRHRLEQAKDELRRIYRRPARGNVHRAREELNG